MSERMPAAEGSHRGVISAPSEKNIVQLISLAEEILDTEGIRAEGIDHARTLEKDELPHGNSSLKEFIDPDTGRTTYEYSEVRREDPKTKHIYRWKKYDTSLTALVGSAIDAEAEPAPNGKMYLIGDTFAHLQGRLNQLRTPI